MGRLLDEDAVIKVLERWQKAFRENSHYVSASDLSLVVKDVRELPSAQPDPQEGHWIKHKIRDQQFIQNGYELVRCSECGMETTANELAGISLLGEEEPHYCPNCGAKMGGKTK